MVIEYENKGLCTACGRNGDMRQIGMQVTELIGVIMLSPINSKGKEGHSFLEIPIEQAGELADELMKLHLKHVK